MSTIYPKVDHHPVWTPPKFTEGDSRVLTINLSPEADRIGSSFTVATWTVDKGKATVSSEAISSNVATARVTTSDDGMSLIKVRLAAVNGTVINQHIKILGVDTYTEDKDYVC